MDLNYTRSLRSLCRAFVELLTEHWGPKLDRPDFCDPTLHISQPSAMSVLVSKFTKSEGGDDDKVPNVTILIVLFQFLNQSNIVNNLSGQPR